MAKINLNDLNLNEDPEEKKLKNKKVFGHMKHKPISDKGRASSKNTKGLTPVKTKIKKMRF